MDQFDDIPDFLWLTKEQRAASWRGRKLTTVHSKSARKDSFDLPCAPSTLPAACSPSNCSGKRNIAPANAWPRSGRER